MAENTRIPALSLPWSPEPGERTRLWTILAMLTALSLPGALLIPGWELPPIEPAAKPPVDMAELLPEPEPIEVKIPEPEPEPEPEPVPEPQPEPEPVVQPPPPEPEVVPPPVVRRPEPKPVETRRPEPAPAPVQSVEEAREVASRSGVLAMQDQLADMRALADLNAPVLAAPIATSAEPSRAQPVDTRAVTAGSGGIRNSTTAAPTAQVALAERGTQRLAPDARPSAAAQGGSQAKKNTGQGSGDRPMSNIRQVFDQNKTAIYAIYNRALRTNPSLQGKVLLELVIEPDGRVSSCKVLSSALGDPELEGRIVARVKMFNFGASKVKQRTVQFPVDFLPP